VGVLRGVAGARIGLLPSAATRGPPSGSGGGDDTLGEAGGRAEVEGRAGRGGRCGGRGRSFHRGSPDAIEGLCGGGERGERLMGVLRGFAGVRCGLLPLAATGKLLARN
jgi:hypothetical protein